MSATRIVGERITMHDEVAEDLQATHERFDASQARRGRVYSTKIAERNKHRLYDETYLGTSPWILSSKTER